MRPYQTAPPATRPTLPLAPHTDGCTGQLPTFMNCAAKRAPKWEVTGTWAGRSGWVIPKKRIQLQTKQTLYLPTELVPAAHQAGPADGPACWRTLGAPERHQSDTLAMPAGGCSCAQSPCSSCPSDARQAGNSLLLRVGRCGCTQNPDCSWAPCHNSLQVQSPFRGRLRCRRPLTQPVLGAPEQGTQVREVTRAQGWALRVRPEPQLKLHESRAL